MQPDNIVDTNDLITKLSRLENRVSQLSQELALDKETITKLKLLLADKQNKISELESALTAAQKTLTEKALLQIQQYKQQIKQGINENAILPAIQQLHQHIQKIQLLIDEIRQFINTQIATINDTVQKTSSLISVLPAQSKEYFIKTYTEIIELQINKLIETLNQYINITRDMLGQKVISPVKNTFNLVAEKSAQLQMNVEDKLYNITGDSIRVFFDDMLFTVKEWLMEQVNHIVNFIKGLSDKLIDMIKNTRSYQSLHDFITSIRYPTNYASAFHFLSPF